MVSGAVTARRKAEGREKVSRATSSHHGPNLAVSVAGCTLVAVAISGVIMYPFHDRSWAGWALAGLTMVLGPCFIAAVDRVTR